MRKMISNFLVRRSFVSSERPHNNRYCATEKSELVLEVPLQDEKYGFDVSSVPIKLQDSFFFEETINNERYISLILESLCGTSEPVPS